jgi:hypothetical protein
LRYITEACPMYPATPPYIAPAVEPRAHQWFAPAISIPRHCTSNDALPMCRVETDNASDINTTACQMFPYKITL